WIGFEEGDNSATRGCDGIAGVDGVAEVAGITEQMAGRHGGRVGGGEGRKQRMRILEVDPLVADLGHRRRGFRRDDPPAQAVWHEQNEIMRRVVLRWLLFCRRKAG